MSTSQEIRNNLNEIKIIENDKILFENKSKCYRCKTEMQLLPCDEDENTIEGIKCPKCKSDDISVFEEMMWD